MVQILQIDRTGLPVKWLELEKAAQHMAKGKVAWSLGDTCAVLHGGTNSRSGLQSTLELKPIISVIGENVGHRGFRTPSWTPRLVFRRDRCLCAYCGQKFNESELTLDHVYPKKLGGKDSFLNLVAACKKCNNFKDCKTPEQAKMPLLYVPYVPNMFEAFILNNRTILADQMSFLSENVPKNSRLWS